MVNEKRIDLLIRLQEQCRAVGREITTVRQEAPQDRSKLQQEFAALKASLCQELPESEESCEAVEKLLAAAKSEPDALPRAYRSFTETVSKLCSKELLASLGSSGFVERGTAEKIFHFFDIAPHASAEIYQLMLDTCAKCSLSAPAESFRHTLHLFEEQPDLLSGEKSPHPGYIYRPSEQHTFERCPICGGEGSPYFRGFSFLQKDFRYPSLPAKLWMRCHACGNLYTWKYPKETLAQSEHAEYVNPDCTKCLTATQAASGYSLFQWSGILNALRTYTKGDTLLEVGVGTGELLAVALEMGYQVDAVELVTSVAQHTADVLGISVWNGDFLRYSVEKAYSIIIMGDVIEHVSDPVQALQNAYRLLEEDGILWLSTPNSESAFSKMCKFNDPMWCEPYHITYFSYRGFAKLAESCGFSIVEYKVSGRHNGYMELILKKNPVAAEPHDSEREAQQAPAGAEMERDEACEGAVSVQALEDLISSGDFSGALDLIEAMPQERRRQWQIQNLTGIVCACCGQPNEARTFFEAALEQRPDDAEILYNLADTYAALGMSRKAKELLERCEQCADSKELMDDIADVRQKLMEQKGGQILMAAYYFPPLSGSGVFRSLRFAKYLSQFGWQPTVISTDRPPNGWNFADESQVKEIPEGMEVVRIPDKISTGRETALDGDRVWALLGFLRDVLRFSPEADRIFSQLSQNKKGIVRLLTFPCSALLWAYDAVQYIEQHMDLDQFQAIYTTSGPSSAHLIGFYLKQKYGIPWVADYRDPWTFNAYGASYDPANEGQRLLFELESVLLHQADCNLTIESSLVKAYAQNFALPADRMVSITNGYDEENFSGLNVPARTDKFTINYSGLLYSGHRSIVPILQAIQQLCEEKEVSLADIRFRIVGNAVPENAAIAQQYGLADVLIHSGYLSHRAALQSNLDSNLLLLLIGDGENLKSFYSAKIFEYLRSGRPILAIAPKDGVVDRLLRESGHGKAFLSSQVSEIKAMILEEYRKWKRDGESKFLHSPVIEEFEGKRLTRQLADVLENVKNAPVQLLEISSAIYNSNYQSGGPADNYHKHYEKSFYYPAWKRAMSYLEPIGRDTAILEIGCGAGQFANMLFDNGFKNYTGFDYAAEGVALAKENNPTHADRFFVADAFQTELMEREYGLVLCFEVLEHIQKDLELLQRIQRGTQMLLSVPNFNDPYHVRYFKNEDEVRERYSKVMHITDISTSVLYQKNCLYYIWGSKL